MKHLKRITLLLLTVVATFNFALAQSSTPSVKGFDGIAVGGPFNVTVNLSNDEKVNIDAASEDLKDVIVEVKDNTLNLRWKSSYTSWRNPTRKINITVNAIKLNRLTVSGSGNLKVNDLLTSNNMSITVSGSGDLSTKIEAQKVACKISGSGSIAISGSANDSDIIVSGSGNFKGQDLKTKSTSVKISGSGNASVHCDDKIDASVSGSGNVSYSGNATNVNTKTSGSGRIKKIG